MTKMGDRCRLGGAGGPSGCARRAAGFTLLELLVVIAIILVLISLLIPNMTGARDQAKRLVCQMNMRNLSIAYVNYAADHSGRLVGGSTGGDSVLPTTEPNWAGDGNSLGAITGCQFYNYVRDLKIYKCPTPRSIIEQGYLRTYSISGPMNGQCAITLRAVTMSQVSHAATTMAFVEDFDDRGYNMGSWISDPLNQWIDAVPGNHGWGDNIGFADGHAQYQRWDPVTVQSVVFYPYLKPSTDGLMRDLQVINKYYWPMGGPH